MAAPLLAQVLVTGLTSAMLLSGTPIAPPPPAISQIQSQYRPGGIDVSSHQHPDNIRINYAKVAASGTRFVLVKATEGLTYFNKHYIEDRTRATSVGLITGSYHYAKPSWQLGSAAEQAKYFAALTLSSRLPGDLPPVLDLEESGGLPPIALQLWVNEFVTVMEKLAGRKPIIYTYPSFWRDDMGNTHRFSDYPLWIADYNGKSNPTKPLPGGWRDWTFWQYSCYGRIRGIPVNVDKNVFNGTIAQLHGMRYRN